MYDELMMTIGSRRAALNQNLALKSQYEKTLQDLADLLETGREKMAGDQKVIVSSREEIQQLLDKHKEYFQGLESHMILTETLFRKIISFAAPQEIQFHAELMDQASSVLKRAHKRGVELEYILEVRSSSFYILLSANPSLFHAWYEQAWGFCSNLWPPTALELSHAHSCGDLAPLQFPVYISESSASL